MPPAAAGLAADSAAISRSASARAAAPRRSAAASAASHLAFSWRNPATDQISDCVDGLERTLIDHRVIPSDFVLLIGRKKG